MGSENNPRQTVVLGLSALAVRGLVAVLIVAAIVFLILGLTTPSSREEKFDRQVTIEPAADSDAGPAAAATGRLDTDFYVRDHLITGAYKVYGLPDGLWLAKIVFRNETGGLIKNLRVRYKCGEHADWCSWQEHKMLVPTQTVVDLYRPILSSKCTSLTTRSPGEVQAEYEYIDAAGVRQSGQASKPITMLGRGDFIFSDLSREEQSGSFQDSVSNADLLAAYVTSKDGPVEALASEANKLAGGAGASQDDENCLKVMRELYEIMRTIKITYQHPSVTFERGKGSFDITLVQSLQYPRDTIRKRSGTCIDLAILYAAMMHSVNIRPRLVILEGHCFPMGITPSGQPVPVEATFVGGGGAQSGSFEQAVEYGVKEWRELVQSGKCYVIDCQQSWTAGINPPELEPLDADILNKWKVIDDIRAAGTQRTTTPPPDNPPQPAALTTGNYSVTLTNAAGQQSTGKAHALVENGKFGLAYEFKYQGVGPDGRQHQGEESGMFIGTIRGRNIAARSQNIVWKMDGQNVQPQGLPYDMALTVGADGRSATGTVTMSNGNRFTWSMQFQQAGGN